MSIIKAIMGAKLNKAPKFSGVAKSVTSTIVRRPINSDVLAKTFEAESAQGQAIVALSGKKVYIKPTTEVYKIPKAKSLQAASYPDDGGCCHGHNGHRDDHGGDGHHHRGCGYHDEGEPCGPQNPPYDPWQPNHPCNEIDD